jgi:hypothetical protein
MQIKNFEDRQMLLKHESYTLVFTTLRPCADRSTVAQVNHVLPKRLDVFNVWNGWNDWNLWNGYFWRTLELLNDFSMERLDLKYLRSPSWQ